MRLGCGWEKGPLQWADSHGLAQVAARMDAVARGAPRLAVPPALARRAADGTSFVEVS